MILEKYKPSLRDTWRWRFAELTDVKELQELISNQSRFEVSDIFSVEDDLMVKKLSIGIVEQQYNHLGEQLIVAVDNTSNKIIAFSWFTRGHWPMYSSMEFAEGVIIELDQTQSTRNKITLLAQIIQQNFMWCFICQIPVLLSNTLRHNQQAFLKLDEQAGFTIRGSMAYRHIGKELL
jgi:hypothetical protein